MLASMYRLRLETMSEQNPVSTSSHAQGDAPTPRKPWVAPSVAELPKLQNLTLQTGGPVGGNQSTFP
jgi:hypothetical protein